MPESDELQAKLKQADPDVVAYVDALKKEIAKLQKKNIALEAANVSQDYRIDALQKEFEKHHADSHMTTEEAEQAAIPFVIDLITKAGGIDAFCIKPHRPQPCEATETVVGQMPLVGQSLT